MGDAAAGKLSSAAYPLIKDVDWQSSLSLTPLPGASPNQVLKAIDKALVMGASMDGARQGDRVGADQPGHGCLQRFRQDRESGRPELPFQLGEPRRCTGGLRCTLVLQGRREGGAALRAILSLFHALDVESAGAPHASNIDAIDLTSAAHSASSTHSFRSRDFFSADEFMYRFCIS